MVLVAQCLRQKTGPDWALLNHHQVHHQVHHQPDTWVLLQSALVGSFAHDNP